MKTRLTQSCIDGRRSKGTERTQTGRSGFLFHQTLIYMTIASALLTMTGIVLHTALKADSSDRRESLFLASLLRADQQLRRDTTQAPLTVNSAGELEALFSTDADEATRIVWKADRGILSRSVQQGETQVGSDRFIFPAGSQIEFMQADTETNPTGATLPGLVIVKITEPSALVTYQAAANGGTNRSKPVAEASPDLPKAVAPPKTVEIRLQGVSR